MYVPGENTYNLKKRLAASELGIIIYLSKFQDDFKSLKSIESQIEETFQNFELIDIEIQLKILQSIKSSINQKTGNSLYNPRRNQ